MSTLKPFAINFDLLTGMSKTEKSTLRSLSGMKGYFADDDAFKNLLAAEDPLVYEFYEIEMPSTDENLLFGTSITYPGKVGNEYFMTKGHFHTILDTAEVYYCLSGEGYLLCENTKGDVKAVELKKGEAVYSPPGYAHRSVNTGNTPLVTFFAFRADAGHDYGTIAEKGFRKLIVDLNGTPSVIDNPKWKES